MFVISPTANRMNPGPLFTGSDSQRQIGFVVPQSEVVGGAMFLDQIVLEKQGLKFIGANDHVDIGGMLNNFRKQ